MRTLLIQSNRLTLHPLGNLRLRATPRQARNVTLGAAKLTQEPATAEIISKAPLRAHSVLATARETCLSRFLLPKEKSLTPAATLLLRKKPSLCTAAEETGSLES